MDTSKVTVPPQVVKKEDYLFFLECVVDGLWSNNSYLAELCKVDRTTIADWKKTNPAIEARREASIDLRAKFKRHDLEKRLKEAGMEVETDKELPQSIIIKIEDYGSQHKVTTETTPSN